MSEAIIKKALDGHLYSMQWTSRGIQVVDLMQLRPKEGDDPLPVIAQPRIQWDGKDEIIMEMRQEGVMIKDIAKRLSLHPATVLYRFKKLCESRGLDPKNDFAAFKKYNTAMEEQVVAWRQAGVPFQEIANRLGIAKPSAFNIYRGWVQRMKRKEAA